MQCLSAECDLHKEADKTQNEEEDFSAPRSSHLFWKQVDHWRYYCLQTCKLKYTNRETRYGLMGSRRRLPAIFIYNFKNAVASWRCPVAHVYIARNPLSKDTFLLLKACYWCERWHFSCENGIQSCKTASAAAFRVRVSSWFHQNKKTRSSVTNRIFCAVPPVSPVTCC